MIGLAHEVDVQFKAPSLDPSAREGAFPLPVDDRAARRYIGRAAFLNQLLESTEEIDANRILVLQLGVDALDVCQGTESVCA
jgi:hypothetical protein